MNHDKNEKEALRKEALMDKPTEKPSRTALLSIVDVLLAIFVVTPLVVFCWRGSWGFMDLHAQYFPIFSCFAIGMAIHFALALSQDSLHAVIIESEKHWSLHIVSHFLRRFYTYVFVTATVLHWRGGWEVLDYLTNVQKSPDRLVKREGSCWLLIAWAVSLISLIALKGLRNCIACPFAICIDKSNYVFKFPTTFWRQTHNNRLYSVLDCAFSIGIIANLVMVYWRGMFALVDILVVPSDFIASSWISAALGVLLVGLVFRLQDCTRIICSKFKGINKIIIADCYIMLSSVATILYWRGFWELINIYFIPDSPDLSHISSHILGFMALVVLNCSNTLLVRGVWKDGKEPGGECVVFPCQYLRIILEQEDSTDTASEEKLLENNNITV